MPTSLLATASLVATTTTTTIITATIYPSIELTHTNPAADAGLCNDRFMPHCDNNALLIACFGTEERH